MSLCISPIKTRTLICFITVIVLLVIFFLGLGLTIYFFYDYYWAEDPPAPITEISSPSAFILDSVVDVSWILPNSDSITSIQIYQGDNLVSTVSRTRHVLLDKSTVDTSEKFTVVALREDGTEHSRKETSIVDTGLPTVVVETKDNEPVIEKTKKIYTNVYIYSPTGERTVLEDAYKTTIKGRGHSSWWQAKKGYNIKFDKKKEVLGMKKAKKWCLIANHVDKTLLRNSYASYLGNNIFNTSWAPTYTQINFIMNGEYLGTYVIAEAVQVNENRVNVPDISDMEDDEGAISGNPYTAGFIVEVDYRLEDPAICFSTPRNVPICLKDPDEVGDAVYQHIQNTVQVAEANLYGTHFRDPDTGYAKYLNIPSFIDYYLINEFLRTLDAPFHTSCYMYYDPEDAKLHMGPIWDFDLSGGNAHHNNGWKQTGWYMRKIHTEETSNWIARLWEHSHFQREVKRRWEEKRKEVKKSFTEVLPAMAKELEPAADANFKRWPILGKTISFSAPGHLNRKTYWDEVNYLLDFLKGRFEWLDHELTSL